MPLTPARRRTLEALLGRVAPGVEGAPPPHETNALDAMERILGVGSPGARAVLEGMLTLLEWMPVTSLQGRQRFSHMTPEAQDRFLDRLAHSKVYPLRAAYRALAALSFFAYYSRPEVRSALDFDPAVRVTWSRGEPNPGARHHPRSHAASPPDSDGRPR